jgi:PIN domain nuclease of toxin-antitoxin system
VKLLLDTHALLWWLAGDSSLSAPARSAMGSDRNDVLVSAASAREIATKYRLGKRPGIAAIAADLAVAFAGQGFRSLPLSFRHGEVAGGLPGPHRDPFDRMLIAQAMIDELVLVSDEAAFDAYAVRLW